MLKLVLLIAACVVASEATFGVDVSTSVPLAGWQCMKQNGVSFAIVRGWESVGQVDSAAVATVANAWAAGLAHVDLYFFPCPKCGNPAGQVQNFHSYFSARGTRYGMLWFDIEGSQYWLGNCAANINFLVALVNEAKALGINVGIYASASQWSAIMCGSTQLGNLPLWWATYNNQPNFANFHPFGGFTKPAIHQYTGTESLCGHGVDKNWYP